MLRFLRSERYLGTFEFFIFIRALQSSVAGLAVTVLVQDKLCLNVYRQSADFCRRIGEHNESTLSAAAAAASDHIRDRILADSTLFGNYRYFMECLPVLTWSLFVGSFLDNYRGGTRLLFTLSIAGSLLAGISYLLNELFFRSWSHYLLLLASATYWITGGQASYMTVTYRYIVMNSGEQLRPLKFMLFQFAIVTGLSLGTFLGGQLLITSPEDDTVPFRTYYYNFALYLAIDLLCLPLALWGLSPSNSPKLDDGDSSGDGDDFNQQSLQPPPQKSGQNFLPVLLNTANVRATFRCFFRARAGRRRAQIYLLYAILFSQVLIFFGNQDVFFQFSEKVYHWNPEVYSRYASVSTLATTVFMTLATVLLVKRWKFADSTLLLISLCSSFGAQLALGTFYTPTAYVASLVIGSLSGFAPITIRNRLSRLVQPEELGKIFALGQSIESLMPFFGSLLFSSLFSLTIGSYPGTIYHFSAGIVVLSVCLFVFERLWCKKEEEEEE